MGMEGPGTMLPCCRLPKIVTRSSIKVHSHMFVSPRYSPIPCWQAGSQAGGQAGWALRCRSLNNNKCLAFWGRAAGLAGCAARDLYLRIPPAPCSLAQMGAARRAEAAQTFRHDMEEISSGILGDGFRSPGPAGNGALGGVIGSVGFRPGWVLGSRVVGLVIVLLPRDCGRGGD